MLNAWRYAMRMQAPLTVNQIIRIGQRIEPQKNQTGLRTVGVRVGNRICPPAENVRALLFGLVELHRNHGMTPMEFYRQLLEIHPFVDGNGRTGKVVLNWLNGTLLEPIFPPKDFWGYPIRNP
jgi:Fic family protein